MLDRELREHQAAEERVRRLLSRLITVLEDERRRIAHDLHDHLGQQLTALRLHLNALFSSKSKPDWRRKAEIVDELTAQIDRDLSFLAWELRPAALDDLGLAAALERFVHEWSGNYGIEAEFLSSEFEGHPLSRDLEISLYRIAQEALNNVYKHAHAARASVMLRRRGGDIVLVVEDDGVGFDLTVEASGPTSGRLGLIGMQERAALLGGTFTLESKPGKGATVLVQVPAAYATSPPSPEPSA